MCDSLHGKKQTQQLHDTTPFQTLVLEILVEERGCPHSSCSNQYLREALSLL